MTLGVESRSQSQEPRCLRILPCPSLSRPLPAMMRAAGGEPGRPGRCRPGRMGGRGMAGACGARAWPNRCWQRDDRRGGRRGACAQAGAGTERRGHGPVPGHRGAVPGPGLRRGPRPGIRHAGPACQARHPGADRPRLLQGPGPARRGPGPGHVRGTTPPGTTFPQARTAPRSAWRSPRSTAPPWNCSATRCSRRSSGSLSRREAAAAPGGAAALRHPPVEGRRHRPLPGRGERPGRRAAGRVRPRPAEPRRPRLLLHGPLDPVLRRRRPPAVARQERREVRPLQDPK